MSLRKFEIQQANDLLEAFIAHSSDGITEAFITDLAEMAELSRVQAQVGLRVLVESGNIVIERRGRRGKPGRFRIVSERSVRLRTVPEPIAVPKTAENNASVAIDLLLRQNGAMERENMALRDRIAVLEARLAYAEASHSFERVVG